MSDPGEGLGAPMLSRHRPAGSYRRLIGAHRAPGTGAPSRGYLLTVALLAGTASMPILAAISTGSATVGSTALPDGSTPFIPTPSVGPVVIPLPVTSQPASTLAAPPSAGPAAPPVPADPATLRPVDRATRRPADPRTGSRVPPVLAELPSGPWPTPRPMPPRRPPPGPSRSTPAPPPSPSPVPAPSGSPTSEPTSSAEPTCTLVPPAPDPTLTGSPAAPTGPAPTFVAPD